MEELLHDMSEINGKPDRITTFVDEDHYHDIETRLYVTGLMMIINKHPIYWYNNTKNTVDISAHISELATMIIPTEFTM